MTTLTLHKWLETALAWIGKLYAIEKELRERRKTEWHEPPFEEQTAHVAADPLQPVDVLQAS